ncbi:carboxylesterase/lipase family protein [Rubrivivax gelatinosus]|uniref:Carboxylesterase n=1 Tax=Rubrivivax gelatinosus (strain NBRC 100245 / IL144) TaxID=983917 RepID=I0HNH0_RUBGI|nr:carboxylesterase family protein [Rubrivivax gelatinosus]BAL94557.1 carboxylesterase [Rubrivivax gelatinosus IL144]
MSSLSKARVETRASRAQHCAPTDSRRDLRRTRRKIAARVCATTAIALSLLSACGGDSDDDQASAYVAARDMVSVTGGTVVAAADSTADMRVFRGIPFAAPPVGSLRWKAPQPVTAWSGVRRSDNFSAACVMADRPAGRVGSILYQQTESQSEDCLYLNVWTAAATAGEKRPVMLLLHGGAYLIGAGSQPNYNGKGLAAKGAVVVTMNYRLGPLGFLAHPELSAESADGTSGNYALYDAIAVLKWIKSNIAALGGDPDNVTIYSESAGAGLASVLYASPLASGLFHKLVLESLAALPAGSDTPTLAQAEAAGSTFAANLGAADLAALRAKSATEIMAGSGAISQPIVDGAVLPDQLDLLIKAGRVNAVPLLAGWNADEGTPYPAFATTLAGYTSKVAATYGSFAEDFKAAYPASSDDDVQAMAYEPMRDGTFAWNVWTLARAHAALAQAPTYLYFFTRRPSYFSDQSFTGLSPAYKFGAHHTLEQVYFYDNLDVSAPARDYTDVDRKIASTASSYLINFARSGDPNGKGLPTWPRFTGPTSQTMEIGDRIAPTTVPFQSQLAFWDRYYSATLGRDLPF